MGVSYIRFKFIWNLLEIYEIKSRQDIIDCGYCDPLGHEIGLILQFQKVHRFIVRALQLWARFALRRGAFAIAIISKKVKRKL